MNTEDQEFEGALGSSFRSMRGRLGPCPSADSLSRYLAGSLTAGDTEAIRSHVSLCGACDGLIERMKAFDMPEPVGAPPEWPSAERRIRSRVFAKRAWWAAFWHPLPAYALAVVAVAGALLFVRHTVPGIAPAAAPAVIAMESVRTIDLNATRRGETTGSAQSSPREFLLLSFFIDVRPGLRYEASMDAGPSKDIVSDDGKGNFSLLYSRVRIGPGAHRLAVSEIDPRTGKTERLIEFPFEL